MELVFTIHGHSCDLALHPVSAKTVRLINEHGSDIYSMKPMDWWRNGKTNTWGMRIDDECAISVTLDGKPIDFERSSITSSPVKIRRRMYLESRAKYVVVFGFDNEICKFSWKWSDVTDFDPAKFEFMVHQWDRIMGVDNYFILDDMLYDGRFACDHHWCEAQGFTLVEPKVIDLEQVRQELQEKGVIDHRGSHFPSPTVGVES
ncbi:hypothetical protein [uncultured Pseudodesulfovibrio sp.]|uniref:hypothetical protein n=1 Tax=uncultured Pseudodesulfovibrio sp. TaxID=2035858 RepID=UPI0029C7E83E|nr:hypothetical protein [uncultured Pseudodesulfovibrio sp.]